MDADGHPERRRAGPSPRFALTSQVWQGITWKHELTVYDPREASHADAMLLFITGGDHQSKQNDNDHKQGFMLAQLCGARVAVLRQVPNQPLLGEKTEDELIAETFVRYLQTKDENWPLLFPMTKSAVRAMDALQALTKEKGRPVRAIRRDGWLEARLDDLVDRRGRRPGRRDRPDGHRHAQHGQAGPEPAQGLGQVQRTDRRLRPARADGKDRDARGNQAVENGRPLHLPGPADQAQAARSTAPTTATGRSTRWTFTGANSRDRNIWSSCPMPAMAWTRTATGPWAAWGRSFATSSPIVPCQVLTWNLARGAGGESTLTIHASPAPVAARIWTARSESRDFRESRWESAPLKPAEKITRYVPKTPSGNLALFGELEYKIDGIPYHLTTSFLEPAVDMPGANSTRP